MYYSKNYRTIVNKYGWITFNNKKAQACIIKSSGDSIQVLASQAFYPRWDYSGKTIYFDRQPFLMKINSDGSQMDTVPVHDMVGVSKMTNRILRVDYETKQLLWRDMSTGVEAPIVTNSSWYPYLAVDNTDENIYWVDGNVYGMNLATLKIDTLLKLPTRCAGDTTIVAEKSYYLWGTNISPGSDKLTFLYQVFIPVSQYKRYRETYVLQIDLKTNRITEIKLFD